MRGVAAWHPGKPIAAAAIPPRLRPWLVDRRSLTRRISRACPGEFQLRLVSQRWERPLRDEAVELALPLARYALVRQVVLLCRGKPWVFARSVIPAQTLKGPRRRIAKLGLRPLGAVLFSDRSVQRQTVRLSHVRPGQPLYNLTVAALGRQPSVVWARRSRFQLGEQPLLVSEVFLPDLANG